MYSAMETFLLSYIERISGMGPSEERAEAVEDLREFYYQFDCVQQFLSRVSCLDYAETANAPIDIPQRTRLIARPANRFSCDTNWLPSQLDLVMPN